MAGHLASILYIVPKARPIHSMNSKNILLSLRSHQTVDEYPAPLLAVPLLDLNISPNNRYDRYRCCLDHPIYGTYQYHNIPASGRVSFHLKLYFPHKQDLN